MPKRLVITIAGAVSLGSYEAGVLYEVLDAIHQHNFAEGVTDDEKILIDVMTGASAGALVWGAHCDTAKNRKATVFRRQQARAALPQSDDQRVNSLPVIIAKEDDSQLEVPHDHIIAARPMLLPARSRFFHGIVGTDPSCLDRRAAVLPKGPLGSDAGIRHGIDVFRNIADKLARSQRPSGSATSPS
jgi:hypothetical protein